MKLPRCITFAAAILGITALTSCDAASSTVSGPSGRKLSLVKPADQSVRQGDAEKFAVVIVRQKFDEAVELVVADLPKGVSIAGGKSLIIPAGAVKLDSMTLVADADAAVVKDHRVSLTAKGPDGISVTEFFTVTVKVRN